MIFYLIGLLGYYKTINKPVPVSICLAFFGIVAIPPATTLYIFLEKHWIFQLIAFVAGWFCWTFIEYFTLRFCLHRKENKNYYSSHPFIYHTQPKKIFTTSVTRLLITTVAISLLSVSILFNSYLFLPAGILTGYAFYGYMHVWLHKSWAAHWFSRLQAFHIQHHYNQCRKCFGVTATWWDRLFNTFSTKDKTINENTKELYFRDLALLENSLTLKHSI